MEFRRRPRRILNLELNIINLIDILVVIIVFLMVTTYGAVIGTIRARLPAAATADTMSSTSPFVIMVTREGNLYVGEHAVAEQELTEELRKALARDQELPVVIQADQDLRYATVVHVMAVAKGAGAQRMVLATARPSQTEPSGGQ
jgi:biopolymer transport protein ExbD